MPSSKGKDRGRKVRRIRNLRRILIVCEDTKSSKDYFEQFQVDPELVEITCIGTGKNTDSLMVEAIAMAIKAREAGSPYEKVWVVFDKDDFPKQNFGRAFDLAKSHLEVVPCWSNQCFEIWYLLHFHYHDSGIERKDIWPKISRLLDKKYDKADKSLHQCLANKMKDALRNAKRLAFENARNGRTTENPSTHVHELVEDLLNLAIPSQWNRNINPKKVPSQRLLAIIECILKTFTSSLNMLRRALINSL